MPGSFRFQFRPSGSTVPSGNSNASTPLNTDTCRVAGGTFVCVSWVASCGALAARVLCGIGVAGGTLSRVQLARQRRRTGKQCRMRECMIVGSAPSDATLAPPSSLSAISQSREEFLGSNLAPCRRRCPRTPPSSVCRHHRRIVPRLPNANHQGTLNTYVAPA